MWGINFAEYENNLAKLWFDYYHGMGKFWILQNNGIIVLLGNIDFLIFYTRAVKINKLVSNFCAVSSFHMIINLHYSHPSSLFWSGFAIAHQRTSTSYITTLLGCKKNLWKYWIFKSLLSFIYYHTHNKLSVQFISINQLEKLEAAKADWLVCLSLLSLTGSFLVLGSYWPYWALLSLTGPYLALLGLI